MQCALHFNDERQKQLSTSDLQKTGWGHPCFQLSKEEMEVRGVLSAIETEEKKQNSTFSLRPVITHLVKATEIIKDQERRLNGKAEKNIQVKKP